MRVLGRIVLGLLGVIVLLALVGFVYQITATALDRANHPPPGQMVDVGGYELYARVMGEANSGPTVILENGGSGIVPQWGWVQPSVAEFGRVVAYDRPGTGRSESAPQELDAIGAASALHALLEKLEVDGPYLLVGHSMGGLMLRVFHMQYPNEVAGMVLVDPRDVTWEGVYTQAELDGAAGFPRIVHVLSHVGIIRLTGFAATQAEGLPEEAFSQAVVVGSTSQYAGGLANELRYGNTASEVLSGRDDLRDVPLIVISAGATDDSFDARRRTAFTALHGALAAQSARGEHRVVPGAQHLTIVTHEQHATEVVAAISEMFDRVAP